MCSGEAPSKPRTKCLSFSEVLQRQRRTRQEGNRPQPWILRKAVIGLVVLILGYATYVYVGRVCVGLIMTEELMPMGVAFLVVFCLLWIMLVWSYIMVVITPPGYAKDFVKRTPAPFPTGSNSLRPPQRPYENVPAGGTGTGTTASRRVYGRDPITPWESSTDIGVGSQLTDAEIDEHDPGERIGTPYDEMPMKQFRNGGDPEAQQTVPPTPSSTRPVHDGEQHTIEEPSDLEPPKQSFSTSNTNEIADLEGVPSHSRLSAALSQAVSITANPCATPTEIALAKDTRERANSQTSSAWDTERKRSVSVSTTRTQPRQPRPTSPHARPRSASLHSLGKLPLPTLEPSAQSLAPPSPMVGQSRRSNRVSASSLPPIAQSRRPPSHPILAPEYRYCSREGFLKPMRAHHCRICATCVLGYDHHCPWIGQCVGWGNHKFFINFLTWVTLFEVWVFATVIAVNAGPVAFASGRRQFDVNGFEIGAIILAAVLAFFTITLLTTHINLTLLNASTVERYGHERMQEREAATLAEMYSWWQFKKKRETIRQWNAEWGRIGKEGNLFWLGSYRNNWEEVMGKNPWGWFLPIGKARGDGLTFPLNPRFDQEGRWRRRSEWPPELR